MPKVIINKHDYKANNIGCTVAMWIRKAGTTMKALAKELGITPQGVSFKIKTNAFTYEDLLTIFEFLEVPDEEILKAMKI